MVISFTHPLARQQLLEKGLVNTARKKRRARTGRDWANSGRGTKKIADVAIKELGQVYLNNLGPYTKRSGFPSLRDWAAAIAQLCKWPGPRAWDRVWIYRVTRIDNVDLTRPLHFYEVHHKDLAEPVILTVTGADLIDRYADLITKPTAILVKDLACSKAGVPWALYPKLHFKKIKKNRGP